MRYDASMKSMLPWLALLLGWVYLPVFASAEAIESGAELYRDCAACHGKDGGGVADGTVPAIGGQPAEVVKRQLQSFRSGARTDLRMQHFSNDDHLAGAEPVDAVSKYVEGLNRVTPPATGSGRELAAGATAFSRSCASCHGPRGQAVASRGIPALAGQHANYLERKIREGAAGQNALGQSHRMIFSRLPPERAAAIADWLSREPL